MATIVPATIKFSEFAEQTAAQDDIFVGLKSGANAQFTYAAAPSDATYILQTADSDLTNAQAIGDLANGFLVGTTSTGVILSRVLTGTSREISITNGGGVGANPVFRIADNPVIPGTSGISIPSGTTGQRVVPSSPNINLRWNTTINAVEYYDHGSTAWEQLAESLPDGPSTSVQYNNGGAFAGSANFTFNGTDVQILGKFRTGTATTQMPFTGILSASAVIEGGNNLTPLIVKTNAAASGYAMLVHNSVPSALNDTVRIQGVGASNTTALLNCLNNANDTTGAATSIFYVRADGKVGVGTDAPDTTLHVVGDEQIIGNLRAGTATTQKPFTNILDANVVFEGENGFAPLIVKTNSTASGYGMLVHSSVPSPLNDTARIQAVGASSTTALLNCLNNANDVTGSATSVFYVRADGNVGVGTDSPSSTLHVVGDAQVDNININGNTITSTDAAGNINLTPDTTGDLVLDGLNWPQADGSSGQVLITNGAAQLSWSSAGSVTVPTVDQTVARFNGTTGALEDSGVTINDSDVMSGITQLNVDNLRVDGNTISSTNTNGDININPDGTGNLVLSSGNFDANNNKVVNLLDPTSDQDAATKKYVDDQIANLIFLQPVRVATTANFTSTYNNGTSGVGATLTATSNGAASIDSTSLSLNDRVLFKNQTTTYENGIYYVSQVGDGSNPAIYTRATDFDEADEINPGDLVTVTDGATLQYTAWLQTATVTTIGTDAITFVQFSASLSGLVTIAGAQTITGAKTFSSDITMSSADIDLNGNSIDGGDLGANTAITSAQIDNININGNTIATTDTNGDLIFEPDGTGIAIFNNSSTVFGLNNSSGYTSLYLGSASTGTTRNGALLANYDSPYEVRLRASNSTSSAPLYFDGSSSTVYGSFQTSGDLWLNSGLSFDSGTNVLSSFLDKNEYNPTITATGSGTITLYSTFNTLGYTRIGNTVTVTGRITVQSVSSPTGNLSISLPVTSANMSEEAGICAGSIIVARTANNINTFTMQVPESSATFFVYGASGTAVSQIASTIVADTGITVNFTYQV